MPAYSKELTCIPGNLYTLVAVQDQVKNRIESLKAQEKLIEDHDAFIDTADNEPVITLHSIG